MKAVCRFAALAAFLAGSAQAQQLAPSPTLDAVKARGSLECGVHLGLPGFSFANDKGEWTGLDVEARPFALVVGKGEARQAEMHAAFEAAARLHRVERRAGR